MPKLNMKLNMKQFQLKSQHDILWTCKAVLKCLCETYGPRTTQLTLKSYPTTYKTHNKIRLILRMLLKKNWGNVTNERIWKQTNICIYMGNDIANTGERIE